MGPLRLEKPQKLVKLNAILQHEVSNTNNDYAHGNHLSKVATPIPSWNVSFNEICPTLKTFSLHPCMMD